LLQSDISPTLGNVHRIQPLKLGVPFSANQ